MCMCTENEQKRKLNLKTLVTRTSTGCFCDLRDDFDVFFAMQDVVDQFVEDDFLQRTQNSS